MGPQGVIRMSMRHAASSRPFFSKAISSASVTGRRPIFLAFLMVLVIAIAAVDSKCFPRSSKIHPTNRAYQLGWGGLYATMRLAMSLYSCEFMCVSLQRLARVLHSTHKLEKR